MMNYSKSDSFNWRGGRWIFTQSVYNEICATIGTRTPEWGGILGSDDNVHITHYYFDKTCKRSGATYTMDTEALNRVIRDWNDRDIRFIGVIHSHPNGVTKPSHGDAALAENIIESMDVGGELFTPIVQVSPELNGNIRIYPYSFKRSVEMNSEKLIIEKEATHSKEERALRDLHKKAANRFSRIEDAFPSYIMRKKTVICIGCGGSRDFLETLARSGVSNFYLYDKDNVEDTNIATQSAYVSEIGRLKVDVIKERILDINPLAKVSCIPKFLDDDVSDEEFAVTTMLEKHDAKDLLLCGCTDDASAQMRCELLSRKYNIPYLAAQVYAGGKGHEVIFTYPGLTKSCCMCMVGSRYKKIFANKLSTGGSSAGTSVWVTMHLNAVKSYLALSILCYDEPDTLYYKLLDRYADSNYFMSKCSDSFVSPAFEPIEHLFVKETDLSLPLGTLAIEQTSEDDCPVCSSSRKTLKKSTIDQLHAILKEFKKSV